jgi:hypothetical protein
MNPQNRYSSSLPMEQIALGLILGAEPEPLIQEWFSRNGQHFGRIYVCIDDTTEADAAERSSRESGHQGLVLFRRRLKGDFAAQRNAVARRVAEDWLLMLDADERLEYRHLQLLPHVLGKVVRERPHVRVMGFARRNTIDGIQTAIWPDWQFRLVRRGVRWRNTAPDIGSSPGCHELPEEVHDRPDAIALLPEVIILHEKTSIRQDRQNALYDAISSGVKLT